MLCFSFRFPGSGFRALSLPIFPSALGVYPPVSLFPLDPLGGGRSPHVTKGALPAGTFGRAAVKTTAKSTDGITDAA